jgi:hypothetical protein
MRGCDDDHGASARDLPGTAGMNLAEEKVDEDGECPEDEVV